jgi:hypothetical protein
MGGIYFLLLYFTVLPIVVEYHPVLLEAPCACTIRPHPITGQRVQGLQQFRAPRHLHAQKPIQMTVNCCIVYCVLCICAPKRKSKTLKCMYCLQKQNITGMMSVVCHTEIYFFPSLQDRFCRPQDLGKFWNLFFSSLTKWKKKKNAQNFQHH